jgi:Delta3-Delta2-enoyl-CoA isomerase
MVELSRTGDVFVLNLGDTENRFNRTSIDALLAAVHTVETTSGPAALVTSGTGKFFSNGLDLDWIGTGTEDAGGFIADVHELLLRVLRLDVITVAAINGHAYAGGAMLACAHDFAIMREDRGYWCLPEVDLGLPLSQEMYTAVSARVRGAALSEAILTGRRYTAPELLVNQMITATAAESDVLPQAIALATSLASKNRTVIGAHKRLLYPHAH